jgi:hypothetical protein
VSEQPESRVVGRKPLGFSTRAPHLSLFAYWLGVEEDHSLKKEGKL